MADDVFWGLDNPTNAAWQAWHGGLVQERAKVLGAVGFRPGIYNDSHSSWADLDYRQFKIFMYDRAFFDSETLRYRTPELIEKLRAQFGKIDSVLLWQGYPQIGFDTRTQFDFYRQMPGGLASLRREVVDVFHANGIRVFLDYNPWDGPAAPQAFEELGATIAALDADGVMLDTLNDVDPRLRAAIEARKPGIVLAPERKLPDKDLSSARQSWAQWYDIGDDSKPSIYRHKWLVPQHVQLTTRRWDTARRRDIIYSFFNGSGLLVWDNIYGTWNPYEASDRRLIAETGTVMEAYREFFTRGRWTPLVPTGVSGLDANRWDFSDQGTEKTIFVLRNRTDQVLHFRLPESRVPGLVYRAFWNNDQSSARGDVPVEPRGTQAVVLERPETFARLLVRFEEAATRAEAAISVPTGHPAYDERTPVPWKLGDASVTPRVDPRSLSSIGMVRIPGGNFTMTIAHKKRETGCYPFGADRSAQWGWYYEDPLTHRIPSDVRSLGMKVHAVTNREFVRFVRERGYFPSDSTRFLAHLPRDSGGALPAEPPAALAELPVTYVSLNDARAYARWKGERLPSEAEWQWAAEGAGQARRWPWGNDDARSRDGKVVNTTGRVAIAYAYGAGASAQGVHQMTGNVWEWTESEWTDGHSRYAFLRGGVFLPPSRSEWVIPRGPRPNSFHAKYLLMSEGLDRSEAIGFRTVVDL